MIDPHRIQLDPENHTVFLMRPGMNDPDLGALAKGYSADCIATFLKSQGVTDALIDLGGNILTVGQHPVKQQPWRIGIQNPVEKEVSTYWSSLSRINLLSPLASTSVI